MTPNGDLQPIIDRIREWHRERQDFLRAEGDATRRIKARCRRLVGGDLKEAQALYKAMMNGQHHPLAEKATVSNAPFLTTRSLLAEQRKRAEKELVKLAQHLPVAPFVESLNGFGYLALAQIVGEAGDLSNYANPAKVWKRFGLGLVDGQRQRKVSDAEEAVTMGYNPRRRSIMYVIGDSLIKKQNRYRDLYLERKAYEQKRDPEMRPIVAHFRAQRYMEKRLLKVLWQEWWRAIFEVEPKQAVPAATA